MRNAGTLSPHLAEFLMEEQGGKCAYCFANLLKTGFHMDHYIPVVLGGRNEDFNIQLTCPTCNLRKNNKHPLDFLKVIWREKCELMAA